MPAAAWCSFLIALLQGLAQRLGAVAEDIHHMLNTDHTPGSSAVHQTIIHGDFKTANLFFSPSAGLNATGVRHTQRALLSLNSYVAV